MSSNLRKLIRLIVEAEVTAPITGGPKFTDPKVTRKRTMESLIQRVARALDLTQVRYLSRSTRITGAYTFVAIDDNYHNIVIKIQPADELYGYTQAQRTIMKLPDEVARHLPRIYKVRTLEEIGVEPPVDDLGRREQLGVIVMERLEELPGDMFELITQPASKSSRSLEVLLREPAAFDDMIDGAIAQSRSTISKVISKSPNPGDEEEKIAILKKELLKIIDDPDTLTPSGDDSPLAELRRITHERIMDWARQVSIDDRGGASTISGTIISHMLGKLGRRAIPKEPKTGKPGALGKIRGVRGLMDAIEYLKSVGITPDDVHGSNIMIRPETGELVLSDLGHFV